MLTIKLPHSDYWKYIKFIFETFTQIEYTYDGYRIVTVDAIKLTYLQVQSLILRNKPATAYDHKGNANNAGRIALSWFLYEMWRKNYLFISDFTYPTKNDWHNEHPYAETLDHKLPKFYYPELTFDVNNWQPMRRDENNNKGVEHTDELVESFSKSIDDLVSDIDNW